MASGKSLTEPPTNLKEAIDWVLRVSGMDNGRENGEGIKGLAEELKNLLDKDAGEVARGVLRVMGGSITDLAESLGKVEEQGMLGRDSVQRKPFKVLVSYLQTFKGNLENVRDYGSSVSGQDRDKLKGWLTGESSGLISKLAEGLKTFIGWQNGSVGQAGIGKQNDYKSAYNSDEAKWNSLNGKDADKETCALIFLGIGPMLFYGLTYLYWWCSKGEQNERWSSQNFTDGSSTLNKFMKAIGFESRYLNNTKNTGSQVAEVLKNTFANELTEDKVKKHSHYAFQKSLSQAEEKKSSLSTSPLSCCFAIASPFFTPNPPHRVSSTSPATPSFLSYSAPAALAGGAYGLNVGGLGTFMGALLA